MSLRIANITFDCQHPPAIADFWAEALGRTINEGASDFFVSLAPDSPSAPSFFFIKVPEGKEAKNRQHLDFETADRESEVARLVTLGATHVADKEEWGHAWSVMSDPEGNEFCVSGPHEEPTAES